MSAPQEPQTMAERITAYLHDHWGDVWAGVEQQPLTIAQVLAVGAVLAPFVEGSAPTNANESRLEAILDDVFDEMEVEEASRARGSFACALAYRLNALGVSAPRAPRAPTGDFEKLLSAYGNASFDCGAWDEDDDPYVPYDDVHKVASEARAAVEKYVDALNGLAAAPPEGKT